MGSDLLKIISTNTSQNIYICDFLNIFSDFREVKYKKTDVNFHDLKYANIKDDTEDFFRLFFTKYTRHINVENTNTFIFVMKKLTNYENVLKNVINKYKDIKIQLIVIETRYTDKLLDCNKDDFLCQYLFEALYKIYNDKCYLISNDKYRNTDEYSTLYKEMYVRILQWKFDRVYGGDYIIGLSDIIPNNKIKRCNISKEKLSKLL